ncbi:MAG: peptide chain release factor N(5)-glutamine methyltransferase [Prevotellaceae bacterium]|jgi:release factor glutamine methyltransferase|nr:peptide chain release factor N(5)-glutamine methyltransferase [Prevotellaceae bacterium]
MTIKLLLQILKQRLNIAGYPKNEARAIIHILFEHYARINRADLYINLDKQLESGVLNKINNAVIWLEKHCPLQYIVGETEFYGLAFYVNENVLIPRPETEELVHWIIEDYTDSENVSVFDIGTGSGAIAVALAKKLNAPLVHAVDISVEALKTAKENAGRNNVDVEFIQQDILASNIQLPQKFDCIVSNPPYVRTSEKKLMQKNVLDYEPPSALFVDDTNPLIFYKAIAETAMEWLNLNGAVYVEINEALPDETRNLFEQYGFSTIVRKDINDKPRMIKAVLN